MAILQNGTPLYDTNGDILHAHGGFMLFYCGYYYWYGEDRRDNNYVSCYRSSDLKNWEFRNHILSTASKAAPLAYETDLMLTNGGDKVNIERPKVMYCEKTGQFVMWAHYENGKDYRCAAAAIATCDTPDGDFTYRGSFNPFGHMSRDCTLYTEDGVTYFVSAANENEDLHIYRLSDDLLTAEKLEKKLYVGQLREAPAFFREAGKTYLLSSYCTGWKPNQGKYAYADSILGDWSPLFDLGDDTTYRSQPAFMLNLQINGETQHIYVGDRWGGSDWDLKDNTFDYFASSYYFSPLTVDGTAVTLPPVDTYTLSAEEGMKIQ